jgi:ribose 5-phosphate isomerase B
MTAMRVHLGSDHAGLELKQHLMTWLREEGHEPLDHGPYVYDAEDDYPPYCLRTGEAVVADAGSLGIVIGGSGNGEQMAANKVTGVRAALVWSADTARLAREHNDANVMSIGARNHSLDDATALVGTFLATEFSGGPRHLRRIGMLTGYEQTGRLPDAPDPDRVGSGARSGD